MSDSEFTYMDIEEEFVDDFTGDFTDNYTNTDNFENIYSNVLAEVLLQDDDDDDDDENHNWDEHSRSSSQVHSITQEEIITITSTSTLTPCVVLDLFGDEVKRCNNTYGLCSLRQLGGMWELDGNDDMVKNNDKHHLLGVCQQHFLFDQNTIHPEHHKSRNPIDSNADIVQIHKCLFCNTKKSFSFSRGPGCSEHSAKINGYNVQIPCIGADCIFTKGSIAQKSSSNYRAHYICTKCFKQQGGHLRTKVGRNKKFVPCGQHGQHHDDIMDALYDIGNWIMSVSASDDRSLQERLLLQLTPVLADFNKHCQTTEVDNPPEATWPSKLLVRAALKLGKVDLTHTETIVPEKAGNVLGEDIASSYSKIQENKKQLEEPSSYKEYCDALPGNLCDFFQAFLTVLQKKKLTAVNKMRIKRNNPSKDIDNAQITRTTTLLVSMILTIAFPGMKIWLTHIMSSICQKPKLLPYLRQILYGAKVISYSKRHENRRESERAYNADPVSRILRETQHMFNLAVIDNIDFAALTFKSGNIFDTPRKTSHATLRLLIQFTLPNAPDDIMEESIDQPLIGESLFTDNFLTKIETEFNVMSDNVNVFNLEHLHSKISENTPLGCSNISDPHIVILEPGKAPNNNENVHAACEMYRTDLQLRNSNSNSNDKNLYIACDQAIYGRLIPYKKQHNDVRLLLGQWHTSKAMLGALIKIFSGYGIFNIAGALGVQYLDKLDRVVDYRVTSHVIELIWCAVGMALCQHIKSRGGRMDEILTGNNQVIKVWYLFFRWTGYFVGHKIGIRKGNYMMQMANLAAFAPLFPAAGKYRYASSVAHFLAQVRDDVQLQKLLKMVCSVNITREGHYLAFDEALEIYGVKFIKQNITGNLVDDETMKTKIKAAQSERDRLSILLAECTGDAVANPNTRANNSHNDLVQSLIMKLSSAFAHFESGSNSTMQNLFDDVPEYNEKGFQNILSLYKAAELRLERIIDEDVYERSETTGGHGKRNVNTYSHAQLEARKKQKEIRTANPSTTQRDTSSVAMSGPTKQARRKTTEEEKAILNRLFEYTDRLPEAAIDKVSKEKELSSWTRDRIKLYWKNNRPKNRG